MSNEEQPQSLLDKPLTKLLPVNLEIVLFAILLIVGIVTRFYDLGIRVMSHDESLHTFYSWLFFRGQGYHHDPMMHGPFQFHIVALIFSLFGDNDFTSRLPAALFGIGSIAMIWKFRRYLGRVGGLVAAALMVISPYMLFYSRYVRNESFVVLFGLLNLYSILRYLESGRTRYLYFFTFASVMHFVTKETAYIYAAETMVFLGLLLLYRIINQGGFTLDRLRKERPFDLLVISATLTLPLLAAFPVQWLGWNPLDYSSAGLGKILLIVAPCFIISFIVGAWWNRTLWLRNALLFWIIFFLLYSTFFTNFTGVFSGLTGSLGYWMKQQAVQRGSQPWYYYLLIQIPIYEFLPALGSILGIIWYIFHGGAKEEPAPTREVDGPEVDTSAPAIPLFIYWSVASLLAFTIAGEKMPWLTVHIVLGMILLAGWAIGNLIETTDWWAAFSKRGLLVMIAIPVFLAGLAGTFGSILSPQPPFQGAELAQLQATVTFLSALIGVVASGWAIFYWIRDWSTSLLYHLFGVFIVILLSVLTFRAALRASFVNYDYATEYLVYAHSAGGVKVDLQQIEDISHRSTGGFKMPIVRDDLTAWPYTWYLRYYTDQLPYDAATIQSANPDVVLVGDTNFATAESLLTKDYYSFETVRLWWPNQDYFALTKERIANAFADPNYRAAIFSIWLDRDFSAYQKAVNTTGYTLEDWNPSSRMRMYVRKDLVTKLWNHGLSPAPAQTDPYLKGKVNLQPDLTVGAPGGEPGQFQAPRGLAIAKDGSIYIADSRNNRIQHVDANGNLIDQWGIFADVAKGTAPGGTFNEPWDVAVAPDGTVYVTDTWNHRIQKFTPDGKPLAMWGTFGQGQTPIDFYGPRGIAIDAGGKVFVTDTGNKRVVVFDRDGKFLTQFGGPDQFNEPVGLTVDSTGQVYVADTWNQQIKVFKPDATGLIYRQVRSWDVYAWFGQSLDNKPFIALDAQNHLFITDPDADRVVEFDANGQFILMWEMPGQNTDIIGLASGITVDLTNHEIWVSDPGNQKIYRFKNPTP